MGRKRLKDEDRKIALNLKIRKKTVDDYKKLMKEKGEHISPNVQKFMENELKKRKE